MVKLNEPVPLREGFLDTIVGVNWGGTPDNSFVMAQEEPDEDEPGLPDAIFYHDRQYQFSNIAKATASARINGASYNRDAKRFHFAGAFGYPPFSALDGCLIQGSTNGLDWTQELNTSQVPKDTWAGAPNVATSGVYLFYDVGKKTTYCLLKSLRVRPAIQDVNIFQFWKYVGSKWSAASAWLPAEPAPPGTVFNPSQIGTETVSGKVANNTLYFQITPANRGSADTVDETSYIGTTTKINVGRSAAGPWQPVLVPVPPPTPPFTQAGLLNVAVGNNHVVACSQYGVASSPDGFTWSRTAIGGPVSSLLIGGVVFIRDDRAAQGRFIYSIGTGVTGRLYSSLDGTDWEPEDNYDTIFLAGPMASGFVK